MATFFARVNAIDLLLFHPRNAIAPGILSENGSAEEAVDAAAEALLDGNVEPSAREEMVRYVATTAVTDEEALPLEDGFGLHPGLDGLKGLWDREKLAVVQRGGAGYPNQKLWRPWGTALRPSTRTAKPTAWRRTCSSSPGASSGGA